ncbi:hypothetical protein ADL06_11445 [Streptomyces sp. NRRL F-6491]|nr:hypothetical protein ADL06_11445 [Streptomyces sp. NRRL F-6491]KOX38888.1 hypothetical protein ADL08_26425 [Streptomyces sp. NRRL F-6492]
MLSLLALAGCGIQKSDVVEAGGAATVVVQPVPEERMVLYFLDPDGQSMPMARDTGPQAPFPTQPVGGPEADRVPYDGFGPGYETSADAPRGGRIPADKVLAALMAGPRPHEAAAGATTALPRGEDLAPHVEAGPAGSDSARLRAPFPVRGLPAAAVRQLVCTTAYAQHPAGRTEVTISGADGTLPAARCED